MKEFPATLSYDQHVRVGDQMLTDQFAQDMQMSAVGREYADAMRKELLHAVHDRDKEIEKLLWMLNESCGQIDIRELSDEYDDMMNETPDA